MANDFFDFIAYCIVKKLSMTSSPSQIKTNALLTTKRKIAAAFHRLKEEKMKSRIKAVRLGIEILRSTMLSDSKLSASAVI